MSNAVEPPQGPRQITAGSRPKTRSDVALVELDGEIVLYDDDARRLHRLNHTAATVWLCLDGSATIEEIAFDIADMHQVDTSTVLAHVIAVSQSFVAEGLLEGSEFTRSGT